MRRIVILALLLAVVVPIMIKRHLINPGDLAGAAVIGTVMVLAVGAMLTRPGSALRRRKH